MPRDKLELKTNMSVSHTCPESGDELVTLKLSEAYIDWYGPQQGSHVQVFICTQCGHKVKLSHKTD